MTSIRTAPYGTWESSVTAARVSAGTRPVGTPRIDGDRIFWLQSLPEEGGRTAVVEFVGGVRHGVTPAPFNVRTRVHEYGGGAWAAAGGTIWFSNFADNLVYSQAGHDAPVAITNDGKQRHADFELDAARRRLIAVREDHTGEGRAREQHRRTRHGGRRFDHAGQRQRFLCRSAPVARGPATRVDQLEPSGHAVGRHELWLAAIADDGSLTHSRCVAGGPAESLCQPVWSPDGHLYVVSDRSGFWNLYRLEGSGLVAICPMKAEFGLPAVGVRAIDLRFCRTARDRRGLP